MTHELVKHQQEPMVVMPALSLAEAVERFNAMGEFVQKIMKLDTDYGKIPGTSKPTLLKPGAEKLSTFFGLRPIFVELIKVLDWTGDGHNGEPFFNYEYKCQLYRGDYVMGEGIGSCNSWEKKYRYRTANLKCPQCGQETVFRSKHNPGWFCWEKKGGCGKNFPANDLTIENQERGLVKNDNPADLVNTISKMAQKRALVAAVLVTVNASEYFTQDVEDMVIDVPFETVDEPAPTPRKPAQKRKAQHGPPSPPEWPADVVDAGEDEPANGASPNLATMDKVAFFRHVVTEIPYYRAVNHAVNALRKMGYDKNYEDYEPAALYDALESYAKKAADEEAA